MCIFMGFTSYFIHKKFYQNETYNSKYGSNIECSLKGMVCCNGAPYNRPESKTCAAQCGIHSHGAASIFSCGMMCNNSHGCRNEHAHRHAMNHSQYHHLAKACDICIQQG